MSNSPYPGIRPFTREETDIFFGREKQTDELIAKLGTTHFIAVVGTSGCGKSSLVRTGMIAGLETGFLAAAGTRWKITEMRPGTQPFQNLAAALNLDESQISHSPLCLHELMRDKPENLLLVVDQFEELFRYADQPDQRAEAAAFVALLLASAQPYPQPDGTISDRIYIVITMRSDFLGDCARFQGLAEAINAGLYLTPRLTREQMREAVEEPAYVMDCEIEPALVTTLLEDVGHDPDQLPLLQHALQRLWIEAEHGKLTLNAYRQYGSLGDALSGRLDNILKSLSPPQQRIAEILFRNLSRRDAEQRDTRQPVRLSRIRDLADTDSETIRQVVEAFGKEGNNFLTATKEQDPLIDISHESLLRQWKTLKAWLDDEAKSAAMYRRIEDAAILWENGESGLWQDLNLSNALAWRKQAKPTVKWAKRYTTRQDGNFFMLANLFLDQSKKAERDRKLKVRFAAGAVFVMICAAAFGFYRQEKKRTRDLYESHLTHTSLLVRQGVEDYAGAKEILKKTEGLDKDVASDRRHARNLLAWYAKLMGGEAEMVYQGAGAALFSAAISPDGKYLAASGEKGTVVIFDADTGKLLQRLEGHDKTAGQVGAVFSVAFHPEGQWLASAGDDATIRLWSVSSWQQIEEWKAPAVVRALAVSPDGKILASGGDDNNITLWATASGKILKTLKGHQAMISEGGLAFSHDGKLIASASYDKTARLWDIERGESHELKGHAANVKSVAFGDDGKLLATSSADRTIILWNAEYGQPVRLLRGHQNMVFGIKFLPLTLPSPLRGEREYLISGSFDRTLRLWDVQSGVTLREYQGHEAGLTGIAIREGKIYSPSNDGTVRRWSGDLPYLRRIELPSEPFSAAISPNADCVVVGFRDGSLRLYSLHDNHLMWEQEKVNTDRITRLAFNKEGTLLVSGSLDGTAKLWRVRNGQLEEKQTFSGHKAEVHAVAFSPDSKTLATASYDGQIGLFSIGTDEKRFIEAHDKCVSTGCAESVTFDASGTKLLSNGYEDGSTKLWNLRTDPPTLLKEFPKSQYMLLWSTLSPDGHRIASVGREQIVNIYSAQTGKIEHRMSGHEQVVFKAIFSPDSQQLATVAADATLRFWDMSNGTELFAIRLPDKIMPPVPLWDFDFRCTPTGCWLAVPLTKGELLIYEMGKIYD